jgi:hypothetical protein
MYKKLILKNDFHNTQATFRVQHNGDIKINDVIRLSPKQIKKAKRLLCCEGCMCSGTLGTRGGWHELGGLEVKLHEDIRYDGHTGSIEGALLVVERIIEK